MSKIKTIFILIFLIFLNGCMQSSSMLGPTITIATTGNIYQAGLSYTTNKIIENETGNSTLYHLNNFFENIDKKKKATEDYITLINSRIRERGNILFLEK